MYGYHIIVLCPKWDSNLGQRRIAVFEDCQAATQTTRPPRPVTKTLLKQKKYFTGAASHTGEEP